MNKILSVEQATQIANELNRKGKSIVLTGGCFDILHIGHIEYLKNAKKKGDVLFVFLESDENIKKLKGKNRPINTQHDRAAILEKLEMIDYIIPLPPIKNNKDYDNLVISLRPAIIAITKGDSNLNTRKRQAALIGARVVEVTSQISNQSTTKLVNMLKEI